MTSANVYLQSLRESHRIEEIARMMTAYILKHVSICK